MRLNIEVTDQDIARAEEILLPPGCTFDHERREFIRDFGTFDLQAVPGSGKTTALLAKLLILEMKLPLLGDHGILVLSHTNGAVDEIKEKIEQHCPKLFSYPHFVGTIQAFTDKFLTVPYYALKFRKRPVRIDNEVYNERVSRLSRTFFKGYSTQEQNNAKRLLLTGDLLYTIRFSHDKENKLVLTDGYNGKVVKFNKPRGNTKPQNYIDWNLSEQEKVKNWLFEFKRSLFGQGFLCFDDAYLLAFEYLSKVPEALEVLRSRFPIVFVDEMQDMDKHQYDLLEKVFFVSETQSSTYQRIGDKNQAIYSGKVKVENYWVDRKKVLKLSNSLRLSSPIATLVERFAIHRTPGFKVVGLNTSSHKPYIFRYTSINVQTVIQAFFDVILTLQNDGLFPKQPRNPIKVVAWNTIWKEGDAKQNDCFRLTDYSAKYIRDRKGVRTDHDNLKQYLYNVKTDEPNLSAVRKVLFNALLKVLRLEEVTDSQKRHLSVSSLISHLKSIDATEFPDAYDKFTLQIYEWSLAVINNKIDQVWGSICSYIPIFLSFFGKKPMQSLDFLDRDSSTSKPPPVELADGKQNLLKCGTLDVELTTVHAVKGKTHSATLYLETCYYGQHESERLTPQFKGDLFDGNGVRHKESAKIAFVAMSRPTDILGFAVLRKRYDALFAGINEEEWTIIDV